MNTYVYVYMYVHVHVAGISAVQVDHLHELHKLDLAVRIEG